MAAYLHWSILDRYTVTPRLDGGSFGYEHAYDANGNLTLIVEYPRIADLDGNYIIDAGDVQAFQAAFQGEDPAADLNGDEVFDQADLTLFTTAFTNAPAGGFYNASLKYDERNQLIGFEARRGGTLLKKASYRYDAFNRRVASFADTNGDESDDIVTYQVYGGQAAWQMLAEYDGADDAANLLRSYVYGLYIDEVVSMRDHATDDDYFYHQDDLFSVYALTDADGVVVERYDYGDYGQVSIMAANGTPRAESAYDNRHAFTGRLLMPELTLDDGGQVLEYRHRYMLASNGRFVQRDPAHYIDGPNLYTALRSNTLRYVDAFGLAIDIRTNPGSLKRLKQLESLERALRVLCPQAALTRKGKDQAPQKELNCPSTVTDPDDPDDPCSDPPGCRILKRLLDSEINYTIDLDPFIGEKPNFDARRKRKPYIIWRPGTDEIPGRHDWEVLWHELIHAYHDSFGIWPYGGYGMEEVLTISEMNELRKWANQCAGLPNPVPPRKPSEHPLVPDDYTEPWKDKPIPDYEPIRFP